MDTDRIALLATPCAPLRALAAALDAEWLELPDADAADAAELERFRRDASTRWRRSRRRLVVAPWCGEPEPGPLTALDDGGWQRRGERPLLAWMVAMGVASECVVDEGAIVALVEAPAPIDSNGWAPECGVAEAAIVLARSLAQSEGARGVRVNAVETPLRVGGGVLAPPPALAGRYPGTVEREIAGAVRMLLSDDASAMTAGVVFADCGRTLR